MSFDHWCDQCFTSMFDHASRCWADDCDEYFDPPLCCPGCGCQSYETAHANLRSQP